jgi:hypothetical protein
VDGTDLMAVIAAASMLSQSKQWKTLFIGYAIRIVSGALDV